MIYIIIYETWEYSYNRPIHPITPFMFDLITRIQSMNNFRDITKPTDNEKLHELINIVYTSIIGNSLYCGCWFMNAKPYDGDIKVLRETICGNHPTLNDSANAEVNIGYYIRDDNADWHIDISNRKYTITKNFTGKFVIN